MSGRISSLHPWTCRGAKSARKVEIGMRRYGDGLFGVGLEELALRMLDARGRGIGVAVTMGVCDVDGIFLTVLAIRRHDVQSFIVAG
jgi:hypothetical protein